jgi:hypothetical protein
MNAPTLYIVLMFMAKVSTDPNVSLAPQFATFHYANDTDGEQLCNHMRKDFNALLVRENATEMGRFECHVMTFDQLEKIQPSISTS